MSYFAETIPNIEGNKKLRTPQIEAYIKVQEYFRNNPSGEALVVLPTGTGKSGLISIAPYGVCNKRVLVITPGIVTKQSVVKTLHPLEENFWLKYDVLFAPEDLPVVEEYDPTMLQSSLEKCNFVIANVHKLYMNNSNSLLNRVPKDFFDLIIIDEAHHSVADSWQTALQYFEQAKRLHVTGTPYRGDKQELPGELIHVTKLSEAMGLRLVKWLRKATVNNANMFFTIPGSMKKYTKDEVLEFKEKEWLERSVALSKECSESVIGESLRCLDEIKSASPKVPHKILAVACSIAHAEDVAGWYSDHGKRPIIVHSDLDSDTLDERFLAIENNQCDVVVSVNMLMEGYDHRYLTILALFRPYRSKNAFAQVVGRVLRAIPEDETTDFAIDNNAYIVFHEETGLNSMWSDFANEVEQSKTHSAKEYDISSGEYRNRDMLYAGIEADDYFISSVDSYLNQFDFNKMFEEARERINQEIEEKVKNSNLDINTADEFREFLKKKQTDESKKQLNALLFEKRPEVARQTARNILYKNSNEAAQSLLHEKGIDPKGYELNGKFRRLLPFIKEPICNDGVIVCYINARLKKKYGSVSQREPEVLLLSQNYMEEVVNELRNMI